jgi:hypothetical protein
LVRSRAGRRVRRVVGSMADGREYRDASSQTESFVIVRSCPCRDRSSGSSESVRRGRGTCRGPGIGHPWDTLLLLVQAGELGYRPGLGRRGRHPGTAEHRGTSVPQGAIPAFGFCAAAHKRGAFGVGESGQFRSACRQHTLPCPDISPGHLTPGLSVHYGIAQNQYSPGTHGWHGLTLLRRQIHSTGILRLQSVIISLIVAVVVWIILSTVVLGRRIAVLSPGLSPHSPGVAPGLRPCSRCQGILWGIAPNVTPIVAIQVGEVVYAHDGSCFDVGTVLYSVDSSGGRL